MAERRKMGMFNTVARSVSFCHAFRRSLGQVRMSWHSSMKRWVNLGQSAPKRKLQGKDISMEVEEQKRIKESTHVSNPLVPMCSTWRNKIWTSRGTCLEWV